MHPEGVYYHALLRSRERSYGSMRRLFESAGSWRAAWEASGDKLDPDKEWEALNSSGISLILNDDPSFPALLREIPFPPFGIYSKGELRIDLPCLAIVGTRKATETGRHLAARFADECSRSCGIASGLAMGIDASAHAGALRGGGYTVAVLAGGLDEVYPKMNSRLGEDILRAGGAWISEYPPGARPKPFRFLERNRLVSGLSRGVLIVEASERSGSLATARFATEQNRDVFVLPGPASHPNYRGSHALIRAGAELVTEPAHILEAWGLAASRAAGPGTDIGNDALSAVLAGAAEPLSVDKICELTHLKAHVVMQMLTLLQIEGRVREEGSGYVCT